MDTKKIIALSFLIIAFSIGYYFIIFLPKQDQIKYDLQKSEQVLKDQRIAGNKKSLGVCIDKAEQKMQKNWDDNCKTKGLKEKCLQPLEIVTLQNTRLEELKNDCFKQYPQN